MIKKFELARRALDFLELHSIEPTEMHFGFALAMCDGVHPDLHRAVNEEIDGGLRLSADSVARLHARFLGPVAQARLATREAAVVHHSTQLGDLTTDAHALATTLHQDVSAMANEAEAWPDASPLVLRLDRAETELAVLREDFLRLHGEIRTIMVRHAADTEARNDEQQATVSQAIAEENATGRTYLLILFRIDQIEHIRTVHGPAVVDNVLKAFMATIRNTFDDRARILPVGEDFVVIISNKAALVAREEVASALINFAARRFKLRGTGEWIGEVTASAGIAVAANDAGASVLDVAQDRLAHAIHSGGNQSAG